MGMSDSSNEMKSNANGNAMNENEFISQMKSNGNE